MAPLHFLLLEHDASRRRAVAEVLRAAGHRVFDTGAAEVVADSLGAPGFDALVVGLGLPSLDVGALRAAICPSPVVPPVSLEAAERSHIARTLEHTGGNRREAASILGISRSTLLHKLRKYGLDESVRRR
jgi:DNA-binding NtrC family response regulator